MTIDLKKLIRGFSSGLRKRNRRRNRQVLGSSQVLETRLLLTAEVEPNDLMASAMNFATANDTLTGEISNVSDVDFFKATLNAGDTFRVAHDVELGPTLEVLNAAGETVAVTRVADELSLTIPTSGTYFVRLTAENSFVDFVGSYSVSTKSTTFAGITETEGNDTTATADALAGETHFLGSLSSSSDADFYSFPGHAGQIVAVNFGNKIQRNPATRVYAPDGTLVKTDRTGFE